MANSDEPEQPKSIASLGGTASAAKLSAAERRERARNAATARWGYNLPVATHGSPDRPLRFGAIEIPCYVLNDERRVIVQTGMLKALSMSKGTSREGEGDRLTKFVTGKSLNPFISKDLLEMIKNPIRFQVPSGGVPAYGYEATVIADLCDAVLEARRQGGLHRQQAHIAAQCEILVRALTKTGIIAMVDEVTGYQEIRERDALAKILEAFIAKELQPYMRMFEADYYKAICTLKGWEYKTSSRRPRALAQITNDIVYSRLAPGVLEKLREKNPVVKGGRRGAKHFQWLTENKGNPELQKHLQRVTGWMEMSETWEEFYSILNKKKPVYRGPTLFDGVPDEDDETQAIIPASSSNEPPQLSSQSQTAPPE